MQIQGLKIKLKTSRNELISISPITRLYNWVKWWEIFDPHPFWPKGKKTSSMCFFYNTSSEHPGKSMSPFEGRTGNTGRGHIPNHGLRSPLMTPVAEQFPSESTAVGGASCVGPQPSVSDALSCLPRGSVSCPEGQRVSGALESIYYFCRCMGPSLLLRVGAWHWSCFQDGAFLKSPGPRGEVGLDAARCGVRSRGRTVGSPLPSWPSCPWAHRRGRKQGQSPYPGQL